MFKDKNQNEQFLCSYGVFIINGMLALSIGSLLPFIRDSLGLQYAFCGMIVSLHSIGNLISGFASVHWLLYGEGKRAFCFLIPSLLSPIF